MFFYDIKSKNFIFILMMKYSKFVTSGQLDPKCKNILIYFAYYYTINLQNMQADI